ARRPLARHIVALLDSGPISAFRLFAVEAEHEVAEDRLGDRLDPQTVAVHVRVRPRERNEVLRDAAARVRLEQPLHDGPRGLQAAPADPGGPGAAVLEVGVAALPA